MKHRFTVPHLEHDRTLELSDWARERGWYVSRVEWPECRFAAGSVESLEIRVTLIPAPGFTHCPRAQISAASGAVLVYDPADRTLAVMLEPDRDRALNEVSRLGEEIGD